MEKAICVYDGGYLCNLKNDDLLFSNCIKSLRKHSNCEIIVYKTKNVNIEQIKNINSIIFIDFDENEWKDKKMSSRIDIVSKYKWDIGDKVIVFDVDMFFLDNPFKIFQNELDYFYTTRSDIKTSQSPINEGLTGFYYSLKIKNFYKYWLNQIINPTWLIFKKKNFDKNKGCGQQFLCCLYENRKNLPVDICDINIFDATCYWNYTTVNNNFDDMYNKISNKSVGVVHLKGEVLKKRKYVLEYLKILNL